MGRPGDFTAKTVGLLAARTGHHCAYPGCDVGTSIPSRDGSGAITIGEAAHIASGSSNGPRSWSDYEDITWEQVRCAENGVWLCAIHAHIIDRDILFHPRERLLQWQQDAEEQAAQGRIYGQSLDAVAPPYVVAPRARAFAKAVSVVLPAFAFRMGGQIRSEQVQAIRHLLQSFYPFLPDHTMHGQEPRLVRLQHKVIEDLDAFAAIFDDRTKFWRDNFGVFLVADRNPETISEADRRLELLWQDVNHISKRWGQGHGYYGTW
jgi:hypothetical protein